MGINRTQQLLNEALGCEVDLTPKRLTKRERLEKKVSALRERQRLRIIQGRTRGAGAGGFNRDVGNITHQIRLAEIELSELP